MIQFLKQSDAEKSFYLYVAYTAAHWPLHAKPEDIFLITRGGMQRDGMFCVRNGDLLGALSRRRESGWVRTGAFTHPDRDSVHECPELFQLPVENRPGESRWILYGAQNRYFIGQFDGKTFHMESGPHGDPRSPQKVGPAGGRGTMYAAQTFSDVPDGRRIQMGWLRTAPDLDAYPDQIVSQAMSLPHEFVLRETDQGLRLLYKPVAELESLRVKLLSEEIDGLSAAAGQLAEVLIEFEESGRHELMINGIDASFDGRSVRIFSDRNTNELYIDGGLEYLCYRREPTETGSQETEVTSGSRIKSLQVHQLKSIW